jgi:predicted GIY-YIG superfamily endonuclease
MKQLTLFPPPKPLLARFGEDFFRSAPRTPGVYIMTGEADRVLYIGQSNNLRARLGAYKNARPDCAPRKIIRLVHEVRSIVWEKCESAERAKWRESELLRLHRPKFNVAGTWPAAPRYFRVALNDSELEIDCFPDRGDSPPVEQQGTPRFGPFKASVLVLYAALARLLWTLAHRVASPADYPAGFFTAKPPRPLRFAFGQNTDGEKSDGQSAAEINNREVAVIFLALCHFLDGANESLIPLLKSRIFPDREPNEILENEAKSGTGFQQAMLAADFEMLELMFVSSK